VALGGVGLNIRLVYTATVLSRLRNAAQAMQMGLATVR